MSIDKIKDEMMTLLLMTTVMVTKIKVAKSGSMKTFMTTVMETKAKRENSIT
jgi:hypothetical protein